MTKRIQEKSAARLSVEDALSRATRENPLTAAQISERTGIHIELVRTHVATACGNGLAHNMRQGQKGAGLYAAGRREHVVTANVGAPRERVSSACYTGERQAPHRSGSEDFLAAPSLHHGERLERKRPALICPSGTSVVGIRGIRP